MNKEYTIRIYIFSEDVGLVFNDMVDSGLISITRSLNGVNGCLTIHDVKTSKNGLKCLIALNIEYLPLDHYEDFVITCPNCGERIDDNMILTIYDENLLSGYNIYCDRDDCGMCMARVKYIG